MLLTLALTDVSSPVLEKCCEWSNTIPLFANRVGTSMSNLVLLLFLSLLLNMLTSYLLPREFGSETLYHPICCNIITSESLRLLKKKRIIKYTAANSGYLAANIKQHVKKRQTNSKTGVLILVGTGLNIQSYVSGYFNSCCLRGNKL